MSCYIPVIVFALLIISGYYGNNVVKFWDYDCIGHPFMCIFSGILYWLILLFVAVSINGSVLPLHILTNKSYIICVTLVPFYIFGPELLSTFGPNNYCTLTSYYDFMNIKCLLFGTLGFLGLSFFWSAAYALNLLLKFNNKIYYGILSLIVYILCSPIIGYFGNLYIKFKDTELNCITNPLYCSVLGLVYLGWIILTVFATNLFLLPLHLYFENSKLYYMFIPLYVILPQVSSLLISSVCIPNSYYGFMNWICMMLGNGILISIGAVWLIIYEIIIYVRKRYYNNTYNII